MDHCPNCSAPTSAKFCANCGQKTGLHRITFAHFIAHDLLHGMFHLDRGILFTIKESIVRPGKAALDYISGKRIRYYNVFYLSLILIGLAVLLTQTGKEDVLSGTDSGSEKFIAFLSSNVKMIILGFVPLLALNARLVFSKIKLNLAEQFIMAGFTFVGVLVLTDVLIIINRLVEITGAGVFFEWVLLILLICVLLFPVWSYANVCWRRYSVLGFAWRISVFYIMLIIELFLLTALAIWMVTGSTEIHIN